MAREINAELLYTKIEKAQQDLVKAKHRYDAAAATLKDLLDKRDANLQRKVYLLLRDALFFFYLLKLYSSHFQMIESR